MAIQTLTNNIDQERAREIEGVDKQRKQQPDKVKDKQKSEENIRKAINDNFGLISDSPPEEIAFVLDEYLKDNVDLFPQFLFDFAANHQSDTFN